jgi:hypothetical protein
MLGCVQEMARMIWEGISENGISLEVPIEMIKHVKVLLFSSIS